MFARGHERRPVEVRIESPPGWKIATSLEGEEEGTLRAANYAELVDSPIEIGTHRVIPFEVEGIPHRYVVWGRGNLDPEKLVADTQAIVRACSRMWSGLPYEHYTFFVHLVAESGGGLEHRASTLLHADPHAFQGKEYEDFLALVAHEFFHVWNGARIRPEPLVDPDLTREAYTRNLWVVEGLTTYYTDLVLRRAGIISEARYLERLSAVLDRYLHLPGRHVQTLADSSFDAWIKFYRQDEHSPNAQISYYQKGALVGLLLDLRIRELTANQRSLDDVMLLLWTRCGAEDRGFPESTAEGIRAAAEEIAGGSLAGFFDDCVDGTEDLDFSELETVGLTLNAADDTRGAIPTPSRATDLREIGIRFDGTSGRVEVTTVFAGGPAHRGGLNARDEIIAIDGHRVAARSIGTRIRDTKPGAVIRLSVFRRNSLLELSMERGSAPTKFRVEAVKEPSDGQKASRDRWLGTTVS
jgi:predicted metalloprotease with PDZ domain